MQNLNLFVFRMIVIYLVFQNHKRRNKEVEREYTNAGFTVDAIQQNSFSSLRLQANETKKGTENRYSDIRVDFFFSYIFYRRKKNVFHDYMPFFSRFACVLFYFFFSFILGVISIVYYLNKSHSEDAAQRLFFFRSTDKKKRFSFDQLKFYAATIRVKLACWIICYSSFFHIWFFV